MADLLALLSSYDCQIRPLIGFQSLEMKARSTSLLPLVANLGSCQKPRSTAHKKSEVDGIAFIFKSSAIFQNGLALSRTVGFPILKLRMVK